MYNNAMGEELSNKIKNMEKKQVMYDNREWEGDGLTGGFLGSLVSAILPSVVGSVGKIFGLGMSGGAECNCNGMEGGAILNKMRDEMLLNGYGKGVKEYKKVDESQYGCGYSGGSGTVEGSFRDTGYEKVEGIKPDIEGAGFLSDLGIPVVSNLFGMIGLGEKTGKRRGRKSKMGMGITGGMIRRQPIFPSTKSFDEMPLIQTARSQPQGEQNQPKQKVVERSVMQSSSMSGGALTKSQHAFLMKLKQKKLSGKKFTKAEMTRLHKMKPKLEGSGFWSDFADGFMSVVKPVASVVKNITGVIPHPYAQSASAVLGALGAGKSGAGKKLNPYMELVMKVKKDKNISLKEAMQYVKKNGLYKK